MHEIPLPEHTVNIIIYFVIVYFSKKKIQNFVSALVDWVDLQKGKLLSFPLLTSKQLQISKSVYFNF